MPISKRQSQTGRQPEKIYETTTIQADMADDQMRAQYPSI
jgi:hypothetical protein